MRPARNALRPATTASRIASAMSSGSRAPAIAVLSSTPSQPSSSATAASDAVPTPASTMMGTPGLGIRNPYNLRIILESARVPIIVDAGVGTASDAAVALELGCDGVLMNTAIAGARDPLMMAEAMRDAVVAGRKAFRAGRIPRKLYATASSPESGLIE